MNSLKKNNLIKYGIPLIIFVSLSSFGLSFMVQDKYDKYDRGSFLPKVNNNKKIFYFRKWKKL